MYTLPKLYANLGLAVESYVLEKLLQKSSNVYYFRKRQKEVDFVICEANQNNGDKYADFSYEVKYQNQIDMRRDAKNLNQISQKLNLSPQVLTKEINHNLENNLVYYPINLLD